jgi:hypothetical protein
MTEIVARTVPAVALKLAKIELAGIVTLAGTGREAEDEVSTTAESAWAGRDMVTVQVVCAPAMSAVGTQDMVDSAGSGDGKDNAGGPVTGIATSGKPVANGKANINICESSVRTGLNVAVSVNKGPVGSDTVFTWLRTMQVICCAVKSVQIIAPVPEAAVMVATSGGALMVTCAATPMLVAEIGIWIV